MGRTFDEQSNERIIRAILRSEASRLPGPRIENIGQDQPVQFRIGKTAAAIAKGASGTVNVYWGTTKGSETWDSVETITAYNRFADVGSGKWVHCIFLLGGWELSAAEC